MFPKSKLKCIMWSSISYYFHYMKITLLWIISTYPLTYCDLHIENIYINKSSIQIDNGNGYHSSTQNVLKIIVIHSIVLK